jgi:hypothetical protein
MSILDFLEDNSDVLTALVGGYIGSQGTDDQVTTQEPYHYAGQKEGIENFLNASKNKYLEGPEQYYPGPTVAGLDPNTIGGQNANLANIDRLNQLGSGMGQGALNLANGGAGRVGGFQLEDQIGFGIDPGLESAVTNPIYRDLEQRVLPGMDLQATQQGAFGGTRQAMMKGQAGAEATERATEALARANLQARQQSIGQRAGDIGAQLQGRGQDINQNLMENQASAAGLSMIPTAQSALGAGAAIQSGVGQARSAYDQLQIDQDKQAWDFNQMAERNALNELGNRMQLNQGGWTRTNEGQDGSLVNILGGIASGYNLGGGGSGGNNFLQQLFGSGSNPQVGADEYLGAEQWGFGG